MYPYCGGSKGGEASLKLLSRRVKERRMRGKDPPLYNGLLFRGNIREVFKRDEVPLSKLLPLPLDKGKGIKGIGLLNNLKEVKND
jgi:hypothetical protein